MKFRTLVTFAALSFAGLFATQAEAATLSFGGNARVIERNNRTIVNFQTVENILGTGIFENAEAVDVGRLVIDPTPIANVFRPVTNFTFDLAPKLDGIADIEFSIFDGSFFKAQGRRAGLIAGTFATEINALDFSEASSTEGVGATVVAFNINRGNGKYGVSVKQYDDVQDVPEPGMLGGLALFSMFGLSKLRKLTAA